MSDTKQPDKYFVISPDLEDYDDTIKRMKLPPGQCFYCADHNEAWHDVKTNTDQGINAAIIVSTEYRKREEA